MNSRARGSEYFAPLLVAGLALLYLSVVGPYTEVPADAWWHLETIQKIFNGDLLGGRVQTDHYWHHLLALLRKLSGADFETFIFVATLTNSVTFILGIYYFSLYVFSRSRMNRRERIMCAVLACILVVMHFGVNIFSYFRYYVFAYSFFNHIIFLFAFVLLADFYRSGRYSATNIYWVALLFLISALVHFQEALFIVVSGVSLAVVKYYSYLKGQGGSGLVGTYQSLAPHIRDNARHGRRVRVSFVVVVIGSIVAIAWSLYGMERRDAVYPFLLEVKAVLPFLGNLYISNPVYQVYQTISVWGLLVYAIYLVDKKRLFKSDILNAGMLVPVLTLFNPIFVDFFLRFSTADRIWRIGYIIPVAFLGAYYIQHYYKALLGKKEIRAGLVLVGLVVLLFPLEYKYLVSRDSRIYTLRSVEEDVNYVIWADLIDYLNGINTSKYVLTDPVTGYVVSASTRHYSQRVKFYDLGHERINYDKYERNTFARYDGWLLIINQRDGGASENGERSGHWARDVLRVSRNYSDSLIRYVQSYPEIFRIRWSQNGIRVYDIIYSS